MYADFINLSLAGGIFFWTKQQIQPPYFTFIVDFVFVNPIQTSFFFLPGTGGRGTPGASIKDTCKIII